MNQILDSMKKIGAALIVVALILIMAISFSSQSTEEILSILAGKDRIGEFRGHEIRKESYGYAYESCQNRYQIYGTVPEVFIEQCAGETLRDLTVMPVVASDLGLDVTEKQIQERIVERLRMQMAMQNQSRLEDDRISLDELFRREMVRFPMFLQLQLARVSLFQDFVATPFPVSVAESEAVARGQDSSFDLDVVAFTNADLLNRFQAEASDAEMKDLYEKDKREAELRAKKEKKEGDFSYPSFEDRREFLKDRLIAEKKKKQLEELKKSIATSGGDLSAVSEKTGQHPEKVAAKFASLNAIKLPSGKVINLTGDRFLADITSSREGVKGPYQDGETTIYLTITGVKLAPVPQKADEKVQQNRQMYLSYSFVKLIVNDYAEKGKFRLIEKSVDSTEKKQ